MWLSCVPTEGEEGGILRNRGEHRLRPMFPKLLYLLVLRRFSRNLWKTQKNKNLKKTESFFFPF